jgi:formimidoylglutamate deiminase
LNDCSVAGADRESLLGHVVFSMERMAVRDVCVAGELVVRDGRHPLQEEIVREFAEVQRSLWR